YSVCSVCLSPTPGVRPSASFFFFHRCGDHRDLHSFPTRRSSDLQVEDHARLAQAHEVAVPLDEARHREPALEVDDLRGLPDVARDRKSTRLNSSHVKISYAVFCLKKKTHRRSA